MTQPAYGNTYAVVLAPEHRRGILRSGLAKDLAIFLEHLHFVLFAFFEYGLGVPDSHECLEMPDCEAEWGAKVKLG